MDNKGSRHLSVEAQSPVHRKSSFNPNKEGQPLVFNNVRDKLDFARLNKNVNASKRLPYQSKKDKSQDIESELQSDRCPTPKTPKDIFIQLFDTSQNEQKRQQRIALKTQDSQYIKDLLKNKQFYNQRLELNTVNLKEQQDSELAIHILKKDFKNKKEIQFLKMAISGLNLFKENSDILFKGNMSTSLFKELKYEFFEEKEEIFNFGEFGYKYYIVLKGSVQLLIPKPEIAKEIEKQREEHQNGKGLLLKKIVSQSNPNSPQFIQRQRKSTLQSDNNFTQILQQTLNSGKKNSVQYGQNSPSMDSLESEERELYDSNLTYEQVLDLYYKGWNQIKTFESGEAFGEIALLTKQRRTGTMICKEDTHTMSLSKDAFDKILGRYHERVKQEKIGFLRKFQVFDGIPVSKLMSLILDMKTHIFQLNNILYEEGDKVDFIYFIKNGEVELSKITNVQVFKDRVLAHEKNANDKFNMYNLKHNRKIQKEQKKRMRISLLTNGECFGDYEIKLDEQIRCQKAIVTRENTEIYSLHKSLLLDMLKTHKITDNIVKQNEQVTKYHDIREKDLIEQQKKNQKALEKLMKKHITKQLQHAMKLPDLSMLSEEEQKILFEQFPYLKSQQQRNLILSQNCVQRISGQSNQQYQLSPKSSENCKHNEENLNIDPINEGNDAHKKNKLANGHIDLERYQEFTSKFLKKSICMKLTQDSQNKKYLLSFIKEKKRKARSKSASRSRERVSSKSDMSSLYMKSDCDDSDSFEQDEIIQDKGTKKKLSLLNDDIYEQNTQQKKRLSQAMSNQSGNNSTNIQQSQTLSLKKIDEKNKRNSLLLQSEKLYSDLQVDKFAKTPQHKIPEQDLDEINREKATSFFYKFHQQSPNLPNNHFKNSNHNQVNSQDGIEFSEQSISQYKSKLNQQESPKIQVDQSQDLFVNQNGTNDNPIFQNNTTEKLNNIFKPNKDNSPSSQNKSIFQNGNSNEQNNIQDKLNSIHDGSNYKILLSNKSNFEENPDLKDISSPNKQHQSAFNDDFKNQQKAFNTPKNSKKQKNDYLNLQNDLSTPLFWIEDNNLLSKEEKRRKISYAIYQSKQFLNQSKLNLSSFSVYVGNEEFKVSTNSLSSSQSLQKQESNIIEKVERLQTEPYSTNHKSQFQQQYQDFNNILQQDKQSNFAKSPKSCKNGLLQKESSFYKQHQEQFCEEEVDPEQEEINKIKQSLLEQNLNDKKNLLQEFVKNDSILIDVKKQPLTTIINEIKRSERNSFSNQTEINKTLNSKNFGKEQENIKRNSLNLKNSFQDNLNLDINPQDQKTDLDNANHSNPKQSSGTEQQNSIQNYQNKVQDNSDFKENNRIKNESLNSSSPVNLLDNLNQSDIKQIQEPNVQKDNNLSEKQIPNTQADKPNNLVFSCDLNQNVRLIDDQNNNATDNDKVDKILDNYYHIKKNGSLPNCNILTSKQKRELVFATNYLLPQQLLNNSNFNINSTLNASGITNLNTSINQNVSMILNTNTNSLPNTSKNQNSYLQNNNMIFQNKNLFTQAANSILNNKPQNFTPHIKQSLSLQRNRQISCTQNNQYQQSNSYLNLTPSLKPITVAADIQQNTSQNTINPKDSQNDSFTIDINNSLRKRNSLKLITSKEYIPLKAAEFIPNFNKNSSEVKNSQQYDSFNKAQGIGLLDSSIMKQKNNTIHSNPQQQNLQQVNDSLNYYYATQTQQASNNLQKNSSTQILQNILLTSQSSNIQNTYFNQRKFSTGLLNNLDSVKQANDINRAKQNSLMLSRSVTQGPKMPIVNNSILQADNNYQKSEEYGIQVKKNQLPLPTLPKILPTPNHNVSCRENSKEMKAQKLLIKRNLI